jgi:hypothetical protein
MQLQKDNCSANFREHLFHFMMAHLRASGAIIVLQTSAFTRNGCSRF